METRGITRVVFLDHDESWYEGFYTVKLDTMTFSSSYCGVTTVHGLNDLPTNDEYLEFFSEDL